MALKGSLHDFTTTQLLNLVNLAKKSGLLTFQTGSGAARLYFREGKLVQAQMTNEDGRLVSALLRADKLPAEQVAKISKQPEARNDVQLGMLLVNAGLLTRDDIVQAVKRYMLDIVAELFQWYDGTFEFSPGAAPPSDRISIPLNLESAIVEGSRRLQEKERLQDELPDLDRVSLRFSSHSDSRMRSVDLTVEEWRVISFISPRNTIRQIAQANNMDDFQIRRIVYGLLQAGLVELIGSEKMAVPAAVGAGTRSGVEKPPAVKRSVIERLISRIQRI
jgi:hypothetical protein